MKNLLEISHLNVGYGAFAAIVDVSLKVEKGELVALLGSNGAGKTTLLNSISGIVRARSGDITFLGRQIVSLPPHKIVESGIVHIPEGRKIFPFMTVERNLLMGAYNKQAWNKRHETLLRVYNLFPQLKERKNLQARLLSGGEQQMLAIGRGLMAQPKLLLIDEPSLGLSPKVILELFDTIKKLHEEGITILLSEQNAHSALRVADRGYVLENGKIALEGVAEKLRSNEYIKKAYLGG